MCNFLQAGLLYLGLSSSLGAKAKVLTKTQMNSFQVQTSKSCQASLSLLYFLLFELHGSGWAEQTAMPETMVNATYTLLLYALPELILTTLGDETIFLATK